MILRIIAQICHTNFGGKRSRSRLPPGCPVVKRLPAPRHLKRATSKGSPCRFHEIQGSFQMAKAAWPSFRWHIGIQSQGADKKSFPHVDRLPYSIKVLLEACLATSTASWSPRRPSRPWRRTTPKKSARSRSPSCPARCCRTSPACPRGRPGRHARRDGADEGSAATPAR